MSAATSPAAIGVVATVKIQSGREAELKSVAHELMAAVRRHEPGNRYYHFFKSRTAADEYVLMEMYESQAAFDFHRGAEHFTALIPRLRAVMDGAPVVRFFDPV